MKRAKLHITHEKPDSVSIKLVGIIIGDGPLTPDEIELIKATIGGRDIDLAHALEAAGHPRNRVTISKYRSGELPCPVEISGALRDYLYAYAVEHLGYYAGIINDTLSEN